MKKVIIGAIIANTLLNSSIAYAKINNEVSYKNITNLEGKTCIPNFYKDMAFGESEVTLNYKQLKELRDEFQDISTKKDWHVKIAKVIYSSNYDKDSYNVKRLQRVVEPKVDDFVAKVEEKLNKEGEAATLKVKVRYTVIVLHYEYGSDPSVIESMYICGIEW